MKLAELAQHIAARLQGRSEFSITGIAALGEVGPEEISFVRESRYAGDAEHTRAAALIVPEGFAGPTHTALLFVTDVDAAVEQVLELFAPPADLPEPGVHPSACIAADAELADDAAIGPHVVIGARTRIGPGTRIAAGCVIGRDVQIGARCVLHPHVIIGWGCILGDGVAIHGNTTIGTDGFGYRFVDGRHRKIAHSGIVAIEDDVEIGANSCIDRAKFGRTLIRRGTKIDNLVQIAHNVQLGEHCIIVAQTGIAGSAELGNYVVLGGQCGIRDHVKIGDAAMAGATTAIDQDIPPGAKVIGTPATPVKEFFRQLSLIRKLPEMAKEIKKLRTQLEKGAKPEDHS